MRAKTDFFSLLKLGVLILASGRVDATLAQESRDVSERRSYAAVGVIAVPEYEGSSSQQVVPLVNGRLQLGNRYIALEGLMARANLLNSSVVEAGPITSVTFGRDSGVSNAAVARLAPIGDTVEAGLFAAWNIPVSGNDRIRLQASAIHDVGNVHKGWIGNLNAGYEAPVGRKWYFAGRANLNFASDDYATRYFTITSAGSAASGLPQFTASGGLKDVGVSLTAVRNFGPRWSLQGVVGVRQLVGDFADSPIVARAGSETQWFGGIALAFNF